MPSIRVATYNVHGCVGIDRRCSETRIAEVIRELGVDLVAIQEVNRSRRNSQEVDQAENIAQQLGWSHCYHPATKTSRGDQGLAVLSRFPFQLRRTAKFPGKAPRFCREDRAVMEVEVTTDDGPIEVLNTHFGLGRSERLVQAQYLTSNGWLQSRTARPLVLLGDLNCRPGSRPYGLLAGELRDVRELVQPRRSRRTLPTVLPAFIVDYIFVNAAWQASGLFVHRSRLARLASDHFPLVAELSC
jgi:endonuclease/exonuclease/phosphatase family metal-dependent hydrolase